MMCSNVAYPVVGFPFARLLLGGWDGIKLYILGDRHYAAIVDGYYMMETGCSDGTGNSADGL